MSHRQFALLVVPREDGSFGVELQERLDKAGREARIVARAWGSPLQAALDQILEALRRSGHRPSDLNRNRNAPLELTEALGVRVGLLLVALKPLRKASRLEKVAAAVRAMPDEEAYYWFAKTSESRRAQRALRVLASGDRR